MEHSSSLKTIRFIILKKSLKLPIFYRILFKKVTILFIVIQSGTIHHSTYRIKIERNKPEPTKVNVHLPGNTCVKIKAKIGEKLINFLPNQNVIIMVNNKINNDYIISNK